MRSPQIRLFDEEMIIDCFAGGGGTSTGIEWATGRSPDIAINHDAEAIAMHAANHPRTKHIRSNIRRVDFRRVCAGRPVGLAWFSPDCTFHSKARGGKPFRHRDRARRIRGLAWEMVRCAREVRPRIMVLENVEEFRDWCPLTRDGRPDPAKRGQTFERFKARLKNLGYTMEFREERAAIHGAPTIRKRLFGVFRRDAAPIVWARPSYGPHGSQPYRTAAECIDFSLPVPSIFLTPAEAKAWGKSHGVPAPKRPLVAASLRRVARGVVRYVIQSAEPFIVRYNSERGDGEFRGQSIDEPISTLDASNRFGLVAATLVNTRNGEREGQAPRVRDIAAPLNTITAQGSQGALITAFLAKHNGGHEATGQTIDRPIDTLVARENKALVSSLLVSLRGHISDHANTGRDVRLPLPTLTAGGTHVAEIRTVLAPPEFVQHYPRAPFVTAFLLKYFGTKKDGCRLDQPLHTITTKDRYAIVIVTVDGEDRAIVDIGMRMLTPRELFLCQGFPPDYKIDIPVRIRQKRGRRYFWIEKSLTKSAQVRLCGNSVCPPHAAAIIRANYVEPSAEGAAA